MLIQIIYWKDPYEEFKSLVSTYLTIQCSDELYANPNHNKNKSNLCAHFVSYAHTQGSLQWDILATVQGVSIKPICPKCFGDLLTNVG